MTISQKLGQILFSSAGATGAFSDYMTIKQLTQSGGEYSNQLVSGNGNFVSFIDFDPFSAPYLSYSKSDVSGAVTADNATFAISPNYDVNYKFFANGDTSNSVTYET